MSSTSESQQHWMQMAKAVKHGHTLKGLRPGTMAKLRKTAESMSEAQLHDFAKVVKR